MERKWRRKIGDEKNTSKHAVGIWEEFSFLHKGKFIRRSGIYFVSLKLDSDYSFSFFSREWQSNHLEIFMWCPKNRHKFVFVRITYGVLENRGTK